MRNFLKPAARTASSRSRRSVRGVAAVVASFALAAGLASYPVGAQETSATATTGTVTGTTAPQRSASTASTAASTASSAASTASSASSSTPKPVVVEPNSVTVERDGDIDRITIRDTDDNPWDSGRKASDEYIWGVKRTGDGDITRIVSVIADGEELDPQYFGYVNGEDFDIIGIDEDAFWTIPPMKLEIEVETTEAGDYAIAEPEEVPTARELSETGYGRTDGAAATVNPDGVGMARAASLPSSKEQLSLTKLAYDVAQGATANKPPRIKLSTTVGGAFEQRNFYLTELVINYNTSSKYALDGPVTLRKNSNESCTVSGSGIKKLSNQSISVDLSGCDPTIAVWKGSGDRISVEFTGPGTPDPSRYSLELYGSWSKPQSGTAKVSVEQGDPTTPKNYRPLPNERGYDSCNYSDGLQVSRTWWDNTPDGGMRVKVIEVETGLADLSTQFDASDSRLKLRVGSDSHGWTELKYDADYTLSVSGSSLYFILKKEIERKPRTQYEYDFEVRIPLKTASTNCKIVMWEQNAPDWLRQNASKLELNVPETQRDELDWLPASAPNPPLRDDICKTKNIALVFDTSDSIGRDGAEASWRTGLEVINTLKGTDSTLAIFNFASQGGRIPRMSTGKLRTNDENDLEQLVNAVNAITNTPESEMAGRGGTNYEAGLEQVPSGEYDVVYFITDGLPTTSFRDYPGYYFDVGTLVNQSDLSRAVEQANRLKNSGTRIETIMVGLEPFNEHILKDDYFSRGNTRQQPENWPKQPGYAYPSYDMVGDDVREGLKNGGRIYMWDVPDEKTATQYDITDQPEIWRAGVRNTTSMGADISSPDALTLVSSYDRLTESLKKLLAETCYSVSLKKVDHDNKSQTLTDYRFEVVDSLGSKGPVPFFDEQTAEVGNLVVGRRYRLAEVKAPSGYSLLTKPIEFALLRNDAGELKLDVSGGESAHPELEVTQSADKLHFTFTVANIRQGNLPSTGGNGVHLPIVIGSVTICIGAFLGRRRVQV